MGSNTLREEHFVVVKRFPNYVVSNFGRVVRIDTDHEITPQIMKNGRTVVRLTKAWQKYTVALRELVAEAFFVDYKRGQGVYFLNDDPTECTVMNLTLQKPIKEKTHRPGTKRPTSIPVIIDQTGQRYESMTAAAHAIGGHPGNIQKCLVGFKKTYLGYTFSYAKD